jgi:DNA polymerase-3 subunit alpha
LSKHPLEAYEEYLSEKTVPLSKITPEADNKKAVVGGIVGAVRQITTKNGQPMAFVKLEDIYGDEIELVIFPNTFKENSDIWQSQTVVVASGRVNASDKNGNSMPEAKIIVDSAEVIETEKLKNFKPTSKKKVIKNQAKKTKETIKNVNSDKPQRLYLRIEDTSKKGLLDSLKQELDKNNGKDEAVLVVGQEKQIIKLPQKIEYSDTLKESLVELLGDDNVKYQ